MLTSSTAAPSGVWRWWNLTPPHWLPDLDLITGSGGDWILTRNNVMNSLPDGICRGQLTDHLLPELPLTGHRCGHWWPQPDHCSAEAQVSKVVIALITRYLAAFKWVHTVTKYTVRWVCHHHVSRGNNIATVVPSSKQNTNRENNKKLHVHYNKKWGFEPEYKELLCLILHWDANNVTEHMANWLGIAHLGK